MLPLWLKIFFALLTGWIFSGIINYIADVLPQNRRLSKPQCKSCGVLSNFSSYLLLNRCSSCNNPIPRRYYYVAISLLIAFIFIAVSQNQWNELLSDLLITAYFTLIIVIDIEHHLILHATSVIGAILTGLIGFLHHGLSTTLIGGAVGLSSMFVLFLFGIGFSKILSKRRGESVEEGLGFGDVILSGICGLLLGWPGISIGLFAGIVLGGFYSLGLVIMHIFQKKYQPFLAIPYGPFLAGATFLFWIFR